MLVTKVNETYSVITGADWPFKNRIIDFLKVQRPDAYFNKLVKLGIQSPFKYFTAIKGDNLFIYNGHRYLLKSFGITPENESSGVQDAEIDSFVNSLKLPFKPYDYQLDTVKKCLKNNKALIKSCTGSGKSLSISIILEFFRRKGLKGILVVPNINLLTQFKNDIESYGLTELLNEVRLLGNGNDSDFTTAVTITTWQSMIDKIPSKPKLDFIICDEVHRETGDTVSSILKESVNTKIKLGFTGTLPEDQVAKMMLLGLFGEPDTVITSKELIARGLASPVSIKAVMLNYPGNVCNQFRQIPDYQKQLKFIKENKARTEVILKIAVSMREKGKNTLVLFQHTEHGKQIYTDIINRLYPEIKLENGNITGRKSFEFQSKVNVYFMNGEQTGEVRERQRNIIENIDGGIIVANYAVMSTGVNMKKLHCLVLASPLKAFTTISQSLGRLMRKHESKKEAVVFDIVDNFGKSCIFMKQYKHRLSASYIPEEFDVQTVKMDLRQP